MVRRAALLVLPAALLAASSARADEAARVDEGLHGELNVIPLFAVGLLPSPSVGVAPSMAFRWPGLSVSLGVHALYSTGKDPVMEGVSTEVALVLAVPTLCGHTGPFFVCGMLQAGELRARGDGRAEVDIRDPWLVAIAGRGGVDWLVSRRFALRAFLEMPVVLGRPTIVIDSTEKWRGASLAMVLGVGFVVPLRGEGP